MVWIQNVYLQIHWVKNISILQKSNHGKVANLWQL